MEEISDTADAIDNKTTERQPSGKCEQEYTVQLHAQLAASYLRVLHVVGVDQHSPPPTIVVVADTEFVGASGFHKMLEPQDRIELSSDDYKSPALPLSY